MATRIERTDVGSKNEFRLTYDNGSKKWTNDRPNDERGDPDEKKELFSDLSVKRGLKKLEKAVMGYAYGRGHSKVVVGAASEFEVSVGSDKAKAAVRAVMKAEKGIEGREAVVRGLEVAMDYLNRDRKKASVGNLWVETGFVRGLGIPSGMKRYGTTVDGVKTWMLNASGKLYKDRYGGISYQWIVHPKREGGKWKVISELSFAPATSGSFANEKFSEFTDSIDISGSGSRGIMGWNKYEIDGEPDDVNPEREIGKLIEIHGRDLKKARKYWREQMKEAKRRMIAEDTVMDSKRVAGELERIAMELHASDGPVMDALEEWNKINDIVMKLDDAASDYDIAASYTGYPAEAAAAGMRDEIRNAQEQLERISSRVLTKLARKEKEFMRKYGNPMEYTYKVRKEIFPV